MNYSLLKRICDFIVAIFLLFLTSPILLIVLICIVIRHPNLSPFYNHTRAGIGGLPFVIFKFRTMLPDSSGTDFLTDRDRSYFLGDLIRSLSLDELPSLINVLRGEMSLVGPRPLLVAYTNKYSAYHAQRLAVLPGLTGLAQVSGRRYLSFSKRFDLDVFYVNNITFFLDLSIMFRTFFVLLNFTHNVNRQSPLEVDDLGLWK